MHALGFHQTWVDRIDSNFAATKLFSQGPRHTVHGRFCRSVNGSTRGRDYPCYRTYIYDAAPIRAKMLRCLFRSKQQTEHVEIKQSVEVIVRNVFQRQELVNSRVVHQNVELSISLF